MDDQKFDLEQIRAVIKIAGESDVSELTVESPTLKVTVKKGTSSAVPAQIATVHLPAGAVPLPAPGAGVDHLVPVVAPMVGTFYRAPNPDAPPFVSEGDVVEPGQTLCVIEAMKLFNEIQSEVGGRVMRVLAESGTPVEYGQPLFLIDPIATS